LLPQKQQAYTALAPNRHFISVSKGLCSCDIFLSAQSVCCIAAVQIHVSNFLHDTLFLQHMSSGGIPTASNVLITAEFMLENEDIVPGPGD
jgi:hypothetical protein